MKQTNNEAGKFLLRMIISIVVGLTITPVVMAFTGAVPFRFFEFWRMNGVVTWLADSWPIFAWGISATAVHSIMTRNDGNVNRNAEDILVSGFFRSTLAGVAEEIVFRWLAFYNAIWGAKLSNFLLLGFTKFMYLYVAAPAADFFTLGKMGHLLYQPDWAVGAGLISANAFFRDGHKYQGIVGFVNNWFIGLFMFWLLFKHGLVACIVVHFLYDMFIFVVQYVDAAVERKLGWI